MQANSTILGFHSRLDSEIGVKRKGFAKSTAAYRSQWPLHLLYDVFLTNLMELFEWPPHLIASDKPLWVICMKRWLHYIIKRGFGGNQKSCLNQFFYYQQWSSVVLLNRTSNRMCRAECKVQIRILVPGQSSAPFSCSQVSLLSRHVLSVHCVHPFLLLTTSVYIAWNEEFLLPVHKTMTKLGNQHW